MTTITKVDVETNTIPGLKASTCRSCQDPSKRYVGEMPVPAEIEDGIGTTPWLGG